MHKFSKLIVIVLVLHICPYNADKSTAAGLYHLTVVKMTVVFL